jgi:hypothetical protein
MSEVRSAPPGSPQFAAFVGIDWADQKRAWADGRIDTNYSSMAPQVVLPCSDRVN